MKAKTNREENYPGPVLIGVLRAMNLRRLSNINRLNNGRNIAIFNIDVLNLQLTLTLELLVGKLSILWSTNISYQHPYV